MLNDTYYIPLWHNELCFNLPNKSKLIIKCIPELPEHIYFDHNNNCTYKFIYHPI